VAVLGGLRLSVPRLVPSAAPEHRRWPWALLAGLALAVALGMWAWSARPFWALPLSGADQSAPAGRAGISLVRAGLNTWLPPLAGLMVQLPLTYLAALGIGALRPLGRHSEWLLVPFSPWLFATASTLGVAWFQLVRQADLLGRTMALLVPALALNVPLLFALTLFFKGQSARWRAARAEGASGAGNVWRELVAPSLPLAVLGGLLALAALAQDLYWPLLVAVGPENLTAGLALLRLQQSFAGPGTGLGAAITTLVWPAALVVLAGLAALQIGYVGRLSLEAGPGE
jgi:hypothetical protein